MDDVTALLELAKSEQVEIQNVSVQSSILNKKKKCNAEDSSVDASTEPTNTTSVNKSDIFIDKFADLTFPAMGGSFVLDAFDLKKKLQSLDPLTQLNRMRESVNFLKTFFLQQLDESNKTIKLTKDSKQIMNDKIVDFLTTEYIIVTNLRAKSLGIPNETMSSCFKKINIDKYVSANYDPKTKFCHLTSENGEMAFGNDSNQSTTLIKNNSILKITNDKVKKNVLLKFKPTNSCKEYCLNNNLKPDTKISYEELYLDPTSEPGGYSLNVPSKDIIFANKKYLPQFYIEMKDWLIESTCKLIIDNNMPATYVFNKDDESYVLSKISKYLSNSYSVASGPLLDIFSALPIALAKENNKNKKSIFISPTRFSEKIANIDSETLITKFVFNAEEIRSTSSGLNNLNTNFNDPVTINYENATKSMQNLTQIFIYFSTVLFLITRLANEVIEPKGFLEQLNEINETIKKDQKNSKNSLKNPKLEKHKSERMKLIVFFTFKNCAIVSMALILIAIYIGYIKKNAAISAYNRFMQNSNGSILVTNANTVMDMFYTDIIKNNVFNIKGSNPTAFSFNSKDDENDKPEDMVYQHIINNTQISKNKLSVNNDNNLETIYHSFISIIESYDKCNSIFNVGDMQYPFPIVEMSIYLVVLLIALISIGYLYMQLLPIDNLKKIQHINKLLTMNKKGDSILYEDLPKEELEFREMKKYEEDNFSSVLVGAGAILFLSGAITFTVLTNTTASKINNVLYGGNLFKKMECYPPNI